MRTLQEEVFTNRNPGAEKELLLLRAEYEKVSVTRATSSMLRLNQAFYEHGEKPGKLLAWQTKQLETRRTVTSVINDSSETITDPSGINNTLWIYYENIYKSQTEFDPQAQKTFMDRLNIPTFPQEFAEQLEADLTQEEISTAIDDMKVGKTPGPDGIPVDFYNVFKYKLLQSLLEIFLEAFQTGSLSRSMAGASTLLPKPGNPTIGVKI